MLHIPLKNTKSVILHVLFWIGVWFFFFYFFSYNSHNTPYVIWFSSFLLPVTMLTSYFFVYFVVRRYLLVKRYFLFVLYALYTLVGSGYLTVITIIGSFIFLSKMEVENMPMMSRNFVFVLILEYLVVALISIAYLLRHNFSSISKYKALENKILETQLKNREQELHYLKQQIHPHFLFNTLNTIYGFALKQSKTTPEIILKLSNLLDYILYQAGEPKVDLKNEIWHIEEYLELEKFRFRDTLNVDFRYDKPVENIQLAPMLFIPFVENAFKHGDIIDGKLSIVIKIGMKEKKLVFYIENSALADKEENPSGGIGLANVKRRLELNHKDRYELKIKQKPNSYSVQLSLNINNLNHE